MQKKKSVAQTVRIPENLKQPIGHRLVELDQSFQTFVMGLIQRDLSGAATSPAAPASVATIPGPFAGLTDDQIWTLTNVAEIMRNQPQGSIFRALDSTLTLAVKEYRATHGRKANEEATPKSQPDQHPRRKTGA